MFDWEVAYESNLLNENRYFKVLRRSLINETEIRFVLKIFYFLAVEKNLRSLKII